MGKAGEMKQGSRISAERISKLKLALKNAEQREERSSGRMKSIAGAAPTAATPSLSPSPTVPGAVRAKASVDKRGAADSDDEDEKEETLRVTTRNQKSFWQDKVTRSRLQEDVRLKGMWDGFHSLKRLTSISKWFGK